MFETVSIKALMLNCIKNKIIVWDSLRLTIKFNKFFEMISIKLVYYLILFNQNNNNVFKILEKSNFNINKSTSIYKIIYLFMIKHVEMNSVL